MKSRAITAKTALRVFHCDQELGYSAVQTNGGGGEVGCPFVVAIERCRKMVCGRLRLVPVDRRRLRGATRVRLAEETSI